MSAVAINPEYELAHGATVIHSDDQLENYSAALFRLSERSERGEKLNKDESELLELLTVLIEDYEEKHYALSPTTPLSMLQTLMDANDMSQRDLARVIRVTESVVSEIINGKRSLTRRHIELLG